MGRWVSISAFSTSVILRIRLVIIVIDVVSTHQVRLVAIIAKEWHKY